MSENRRFEIRGETRLKNAKLVRAREEVGMSQKDFAKHVEIPYGALNAYENLRAYPIPKHRKILANFCDCSEEGLFPQELKRYAEGEEPRTLIQVAEVEPSRLLGVVRRQALLVASTGTPGTEFDDLELKEEIRRAIDAMRNQRTGKKKWALCAQVLELCFGLSGKDPMDLEQIGTLLGVSRERVRQRKEYGLRFLRRQSIIHKLEVFRDKADGAVDSGVNMTAFNLSLPGRHIPSSRFDRIRSETMLAQKLRKKARG